MNESRLIYEIMQILGKHAKVFRCQAGSPVLADGITRYNGLPKGFSDILAILPNGRAAFIEVKSGNAKATPEQERFLAQMRDTGALAGIARSISEAFAICNLEDDIEDYL